LPIHVTWPPDRATATDLRDGRRDSDRLEDDVRALAARRRADGLDGVDRGDVDGEVRPERLRDGQAMRAAVRDRHPGDAALRTASRVSNPIAPAPTMTTRSLGSIGVMATAWSATASGSTSAATSYGTDGGNRTANAAGTTIRSA
jgi:hypothetical protein